MHDKKSNPFEDIGKKIFDKLPDSLTDITESARSNVKQSIMGVLSESGMVSRDEFDHQQRLLERTREKLDKLEKDLALLESKINA